MILCLDMTPVRQGTPWFVSCSRFGVVLIPCPSPFRDMSTPSRWTRAQEYEESFWRSVAEEVAQNSLNRIDFYEWRASELRRRLATAGRGALLDGNHRIMEIGSGPVGIVGHLPGRDRIAVDPLSRFYSSDPHLKRFRSKEVRYIDSPGEALPVDDGSYDLIVMENCIDHTRDPSLVLKEIHRALSSDGILYITVNGRARVGYFIHRCLARLKLDPGHPHTYTERRFRRSLEGSGFLFLSFESESWKEAWLADLKAETFRDRMKGILLVSEHLLTALAAKRT